MTTDLRIFGGRLSGGPSPERLRALAGWIRPISSAAISAGLMGWLVLFFMFQQGGAPRVELLAVIVGLISLVGVLLPFGADFLLTEAQSTQRAAVGNQQLQAALHAQLSGRWALYQQLNLPSGENLDGVLLGEDGIFALQIESKSGTYRNDHHNWQMRNAEQQWESIEPNPSHQITGRAEQLAALFADKTQPVAVLPRIVWAGDGLLMADEPAVSIWQLNVDDAIRDDLAQRASANLSRETLAELSDLLHAISAEPLQ